jgi:NTE family protein
MMQASSYEEWKQAAIAEDERTGAARWKAEDRSRRYDYQVIRNRLDEIREVRAAGDPHRILFYLNEGIHGNTGGIGSSALYRRSHFGTKDLVTSYTNELAGALDDVANADPKDVSHAEQLEFFRRASHCFGRTALMFSGGGMLGLFHVGVSKTLVEQGLMPSVLSGASAGSIVAGILGTLDGTELAAAMEGNTILEAFAELAEGSMEIAGGRTRMRADEVQSFIESQIPDLTFAEAFEKTGRQINITISPRELHQQSRLMNAITSPNVMIRETVRASCAIPGIFPPVTLAAKDRTGKRVPYVASRKWTDGSVTNDLPTRQLGRLYGVNHFITSQTNPVALWSLRDTAAKDTLAAKFWEIGQNATREAFRATYPLSMRLTRSVPPVNHFVRMAYSVATQTYTADVNILPRTRFWNPSKLLSVLSEEETQWLIEEGEVATWPKVEQIRNTSRVSRRLYAILERLESESLSAMT